MVGLVRIVGANPRLLNNNHQVMAFGYDLEGTALTLSIYDPNYPGETVTLSLDVGDPRGSVTTTYSKPGPPVLCFFRAPYEAEPPSAWR
jgi:hypothetical protein